MLDISELSIDDQKSMLNSMISVILSSPISKNGTLNNDTIAITTDIHGDLFSLLSSLVECGAVIVRENDFMYYNITANRFLKEKDIINQPKEYFIENKICVFPNPHINSNFNANYYNLGDIGDRGTESVACYALLYYTIFKYKKIDKSPIHLVIGNHESSKYFAAGDTYDKYYKILKSLINYGYMQTGYVIGNGENTAALWHARLVEDDIETIFKDFKLLLLPNNKKTFFYKIIKNQFESNDTELFNKLLDFLSTTPEQELTKKAIIFFFEKEELAKIKILLGNSIIKSYLKIDKEKIYDIFKIFKNDQGASKDFLTKVLELRGDIPCNLLFWNDETVSGTPLLNQIVGHDSHPATINANNCYNKSIVNIDITRSNGYLKRYCGYEYLKNKSLSATSYYKVNKDGNINVLELSKQTAYETTRTLADSGSYYIFSPIEDIALLYPDIIKVNDDDIFQQKIQRVNSDENFKKLSITEPASKINMLEKDTTPNNSSTNIYNDDIQISIAKNVLQQINELTNNKIKSNENNCYVNSTEINLDELYSYIDTIYNFCIQNKNSTIINIVSNTLKDSYVDNFRTNDRDIISTLIKNKKITSSIKTINS